MQLIVVAGIDLFAVKSVLKIKEKAVDLMQAELYKMKKNNFLIALTLLMIISFSFCTERKGHYLPDDNPPFQCRVIIKQDACGITDIGRNLEWLFDLIYLSFNDETGDYHGRIWVKSRNGIDYIVTDMPLSSGHQGYHLFKCDGTEVTLEGNSFLASLTNRDLVWVSHCPQPGTTD